MFLTNLSRQLTLASSHTCTQTYCVSPAGLRVAALIYTKWIQMEIEGFPKCLSASSPPPPPVFVESLVTLATNVQHGVQLSRLVSQQALQVADEAVDVALPRRLAYDVFVVVVAQTATQLLIVHLGFVLPPAPEQRHLETEQHRNTRKQQQGSAVCFFSSFTSSQTAIKWWITVLC